MEERKTIFPDDCAMNPFDRKQVKWEDYLFELTPVQKVGEIWFKREDYFAPLGYNSVNGSKMRQCVWLVNQWVNQKNVRGVISGSVVGSPQHPFISSICKHYGISCLTVTGSKNHQEHKNMQLAKLMGSKFYISKVGYAKTLEAICYRLQKKLPYHEVLETNITVDEKRNSPERIEAFHNVGAYQVKNIPDHIETLIVPAGSCNSITSILYGLTQFPPKNLKRIIIMGIGNNGSKNLKYIPKRLEIIGKVIDKNLNQYFDWRFIGGNPGCYEMEYFNLNGSGFCQYSDWFEEGYHGIKFHPRYEGKLWRYIQGNMEIFKPYFNDKTLFWIVGNVPEYV